MPSRKTGQKFASFPTVWIRILSGRGAADFECHSDEPLRIASHPACCQVRETARQLLDSASICWTEVFVGGTSAVKAALSAGLAVAAFPYRLA